MSGREFPPAWSTVPALAAVRAIADVRRRFDPLRPTVRHTLRVASSPELLDGGGSHTGPGQARVVPCVWGFRRDEYRWDDGVAGGHHDVVAFRTAAAAAAVVLHCHYRSDAWSGLLPGTIGQVLGTRSDLYLADYWVSVLHHLAWTGRLPYPIGARWVFGDGGEPGPYHFTRDLPTDLAEASREALILFEEAAVGGQAERGGPGFASGLPIQRSGRWRLVVPGESNAATADAVTPSVDPPSSVGVEARSPMVATSSPGEPDIGDAGDNRRDEGGPVLPALRLDDQTFTARYGAGWYRFPPRSKLLFALLERVARRPGHRVDFDDLRTIGDVWDGSPVEDSTVRGAVARLRGVLEENEMGGLAERIRTGTYRGRGYVLLDTSARSEDDDE